MNGQLDHHLRRYRAAAGTDAAEVHRGDIEIAGWPVFTRWIHGPRARRWPEHAHDGAELIWDVTGTVAVRTGTSIWIVPPSLGLWLPAGARHEILAGAGTAFACTWVSRGETAVVDRWPAPALVTVGTIAREALRELGEPGLPRPVHDRLVAVAFDFVTDAAGPGRLPLPTDRRALVVAQALVDDPADDRHLADWARLAHASVRTLSRLFVHQTGLTFAAWRSELRLRHSLALLADGHPIATVAERVGYDSTSAFSAAFRRSLGRSPGAFAQSR